MRVFLNKWKNGYYFFQKALFPKFKTLIGRYYLCIINTYAIPIHEFEQILAFCRRLFNGNHHSEGKNLPSTLFGFGVWAILPYKAT